MSIFLCHNDDRSHTQQTAAVCRYKNSIDDVRPSCVEEKLGGGWDGEGIQRIWVRKKWGMGNVKKEQQRSKEHEGGQWNSYL